jgi:hypothetical protein
MVKWCHEIDVQVRTSPEDWDDVVVCLYVSGSPATRDYFCQSHGNWLPGDPAELELLGIEVLDNGTWRKALPACYPDTFDQAILDAVEEWWDACSELCWDSLDEDGDLADYRRDAMEGI